MKRLTQCSLPYTSYIDGQVALDALDWCVDHKGFGEFAFSWVLTTVYKHDENNTLAIGLFEFNDSRDHTMFNIVWT